MIFTWVYGFITDTTFIVSQSQQVISIIVKYVLFLNLYI